MKKVMGSLVEALFLLALSGPAWPAQPTPVSKSSLKEKAHKNSKHKKTKTGKAVSAIPPSAQATPTQEAVSKKHWWHFW